MSGDRMSGEKPTKPDSTTLARTPAVTRRLLAVAFAIALAGGFVWAIARIGDEARRSIGPRDRYAVRFADLICDAPPGLDRSGFLAEVRYVSSAPETLQSLEPELAVKLAKAFTAHPWVEHFDGVSVSPAGEISVLLRFRVPSLAVQTGSGLRVVDATGVVLPLTTATQGLPELMGVSTPPPLAGRSWADPAVKRALELHQAHHPKRLEYSPQGWRLTLPEGTTLVVEK